MAFPTSTLWMIVTGIIVLVSIATYIIPVEIMSERGRDRRAGRGYPRIDHSGLIPVHGIGAPGIQTDMDVLMEGAIEAADISFSIFLCAGAFTAIIATGAVTNGINSLAKKFGTEHIS